MTEPSRPVYKARRYRYGQQRLAPWRDAFDCDALGRLHHAVNDEGDGCVDAHGVLWFRWTPSAARDELARQLQLLSLMAVLCAGDAGEFEELLSDFDDAYTQYFLEQRARYEPVYSMGVYIKIDDDEMLALVAEALLSDDERTNERRYATVKKDLLVGCDKMERVPIWIEFESGGVVPKKAIASSLALADRLNGRRDESQLQDDFRIGAAFQLSAVQLDIDDGAQLDVQSMAQLAALVEAGVRLPYFQFGVPFSIARTADVLTQTVQSIHALLGPRCVEESDDANRPRVEHLEVTTPMPTSLAVPVCTAIVQSKTIRFLEIDHNMARSFGREQFPMDRFWRWLAYALFSHDATHNIQKLEVTAEILGEFDADFIREVLAMEDPLLALIDPRSGIESPAKDAFVSIPSGTEIALVYDYTRARKDIAVFTSASPLISLRVLQNDKTDGWVTFVLPGWGEARVRSELVSVEQGHEVAHVSAHASPRGIQHLRVDYISSEDIDAVCAFLDVVGPHIRRLDIHEFDAEVQDVAAHIISFARRCPSLEMLDLFAVKLATIQPLVDAYARGDYAIKTFKFRQLQVEDMSSMHAFFDTLADPSHPMAACLRELSFHVFEQTIQDASRGSILSSCAEMLKENKQLQICRAITMSKRRCSQFSSVFQEFDDEPLPARKGPLALRSKLAFLSVVMGVAHDTSNPGKKSARALCRLDTNVVQAIFKFAAENEFRQSVVEVPVRKWV